MELNLLETIFLCTSEYILVDNCIYSTSQLAKMHWPSMDTLSICIEFFIVDNNKYMSLEPVAKGHLPTMTQLHIEWSKDDHTTCQDIRDVVKLQSIKFQNLCSSTKM